MHTQCCFALFECSIAWPLTYLPQCMSPQYKHSHGLIVLEHTETGEKIMY